jgi:hypothetical protein
MTCYKAVLIACVLSAVSLSADAPVTLKVESGFYLFEPAWIRLKVQVEPDEANRLLRVEIVSDGFSRSSDEDLYGTRSRRTRWIDYPDVPAGDYTVTARVERPTQQPWIATDRFRVIGRDY